MKDLVILAAPCLMLAMLYCGWRAVAMLGTHRAAVAVVRDSDYGERERRDDFWHFGFTIGTLRGWNWRDGRDARLIRDDIEFADAAGARHRARVERRVRRGWRPSDAYVVWYDTTDPARVTAFGPGYWLMIALALAVSLVGVFDACIKLARL